MADYRRFCNFLPNVSISLSSFTGSFTTWIYWNVFENGRSNTISIFLFLTFWHKLFWQVFVFLWKSTDATTARVKFALRKSNLQSNFCQRTLKCQNLPVRFRWIYLPVWKLWVNDRIFLSIVMFHRFPFFYDMIFGYVDSLSELPEFHKTSHFAP